MQDKSSGENGRGSGASVQCRSHNIVKNWPKRVIFQKWITNTELLTHPLSNNAWSEAVSIRVAVNY